MSSSTQPVQALRLGPLTLQPVSDGAILQMDPASIFRDAPREQWQPHLSLNGKGNLELALTCLLVRVGDHTILVDTGYGALPDRPEVGQLTHSLAKIGVAPGDIDTVVISHPHGDHIGGTTVGTGEAAQLMYPAARHWLGRADWEHFSTPEMLQQRGLVDKLACQRPASGPGRWGTRDCARRALATAPGAYARAHGRGIHVWPGDGYLRR